MKLKKGQNSHKNQGSLYSNTVEGQTWHIHVDKYPQWLHRR
jgi:hypothetical protein